MEREKHCISDHIDSMIEMKHWQFEKIKSKVIYRLSRAKRSECNANIADIIYRC